MRTRPSGRSASGEAVALDEALAVLRSRSRAWVTTSLAEKGHLLRALHAATAEVADWWVAESCRAKGIDPPGPSAAEEWLTGPYAMLVQIEALTRQVERLDAGVDPLARTGARTMTNGRVALRVFPFTARDLLLAGYRAHVWLRPGVTVEEARAGVASRLGDRDGHGEVCVVLGAGNINAIPPLDALSKLFADGAVVLIKLNPVNAYLEPVLERAFEAFVRRGFVRITSGGADVGSYLTRHPDVDAIHITGGRASHDAIVFGAGEEGERRRARREPLTDKRITSELGGVGPVIVVPSRWTDAELRHQAEHVATQRLHNGGFNCAATQVVVVPARWRQADRFVDLLRHALRTAPERPAHQPDAAARQRAAVDTHPDAETLGGDRSAPRTLLPDLDPDEAEESAFREEYFGPVLGITRLDGAGPAEFLDNAVGFCNDRLAGDLAAGVIAAPRTMRRLGPSFDAAVRRLRFGTVAINCWVGVVFAIPRASWGAFPGNELHDVGSGMGIVHNGLLLDPDHVERSVGRGPFRPRPEPVWFVGNATARATAEHMTRLAAGGSIPEQLRHAASAAGSSLRGRTDRASR